MSALPPNTEARSQEWDRRQMDLERILGELHGERNRVVRMIEALEKRGDGNKAAPRRRGRKSMDAAARREVSERMRRYWAARRLQTGRTAA